MIFELFIKADSSRYLNINAQANQNRLEKKQKWSQHMSEKFLALSDSEVYYRLVGKTETSMIFHGLREKHTSKCILSFLWNMRVFTLRSKDEKNQNTGKELFSREEKAKR